MIGDCLNLYYHHFDIYLCCHANSAWPVTTKNFCGYILGNTGNHQLAGFDMLAKDSEVGHSMKLKKEVKSSHRSGVDFVHIYIYTLL